jgi:predicted phage-related endonuclease
MNAPRDIPESIGGATRNLYRNASSAPAIMGESPFGGWDAQRKTYRGLEGAFKGNFATDHGHTFEPVAREAFAEKAGVELLGPTRVIAGEYAASLDDRYYYEGELWLAEIKCPVPTKKRTPKDSAIWKSVMEYGDPSHYGWQCQHQLMCVPEAVGVTFFVYDSETGDSVECEVLRDEVAIAQLRAQWDKFWAWMQTDEPDPNVEQWVERTDSAWHYAVKEFKELSALADKAKEALEAARKELVELCEAPKTRGGGVTVITTTRKGNVDYKKIPELQGVDLEQYRGESTEVTTVSIPKEKK